MEAKTSRCSGDSNHWPSYDDIMSWENMNEAPYSPKHVLTASDRLDNLSLDDHNPESPTTTPFTADHNNNNAEPESPVTSISQLDQQPNGKEQIKSPLPDSEQSMDAETEAMLEDEAAIRFLCDIDRGMSLLLDRIKEDLSSCKEAATFFRKRAAIEEEYAKSLSKLSRSAGDSYQICGGKAGSFSASWLNLLRVHDQICENRMRFSGNLQEMSEELSMLGKEIDRSRKQLKDTGQRYEKGFQDAEIGLEKAKARYELHTEEWEKVLHIQRGEDPPPPIASQNAKRTLGKSMGTLFKQPKTPGQLVKLEEDTRLRAHQSNDQYKSTLRTTNQTRQEFFHVHMPKVVRSLKEASDEIDLGLLYHLERYAFLFENVLLNDGIVISPLAPEDGPGLRAVVEQINTRQDFKTYMLDHSTGSRNLVKEDYRFEEYGVAKEGGTATKQPVYVWRLFGVDLADQMLRDNQEVPFIMEKCTAIIEEFGLQSQGIYRLSGTSSNVQRLKFLLDQNVETIDLTSHDVFTDINDIAGVLKLWLRELPDPLMTRALYSEFIEAAKVENDRLRAISIHERVNLLPDPNYATLKFLLAHLHRVQSHEDVNRMSVSNLAIVFGPTLMGIGVNEGSSLADMSLACKVVESILSNYRGIFEQPEEEEEEEEKEEEEEDVVRKEEEKEETESGK